MNTTKPTTPQQYASNLETIEQRADAYLAKLRERSMPKKPPVPWEVAVTFLAAFLALVISGPKAMLITAGVVAVLLFVALPIALAIHASED